MKLPDLKKLNEQVQDAEARRVINKLIDIIIELNKEVEICKKKEVTQIIYRDSPSGY